MADSSGWTPDSHVLSSVLELFRSAQNPSGEVQKRVSAGIEELKNRSDGSYYLCYIFAEPKLEEEVRQLAGLVLKNISPGRYMNEWVGRKILEGLCDSSEVIRSTSGSIITNILRTVGIGNWPEALSVLHKLVLNAPSLNVAVSVLETYKKIVQDEVEDNPTSNLDSPNQRSGPSPAFVAISENEFIPMLLELCNNEHLDKRLKLVCLQILELFNTAHCFAYQEFGHKFFQAYWDCIGRVAMDKNFKLTVLNAFNTILEYNVDIIIAKSSYIFPFFVECCNDPDYNVRLAAMKFWPDIVKEAGYNTSEGSVKDLLAPHVQRLTAILVEHTRCSDIDLAEIDPAQLEDENALVPDVTNMAPRFHQTRALGVEFADPDDDNDDEDPRSKSAWGNVWTVRKAAGLALDTLAVRYGGELMLPVCLPIIERKLQTQEDLNINNTIVPAWIERESGILILGAISKGCISSLDRFIPNILNLLIKLSNDLKPLLRSISCWCIARFSTWYCNTQQPTNLSLELPALASEVLGSNVNRPSTYLQQALYTLLIRMLDMNKCVQEASCSAIAVMMEDVGSKKIGITVKQQSAGTFDARNIIAMELPIIYEVFGKCLRFYQSKNLTLLLDAISSLSQAIGSDMTEAHPNYVNEKLFAPMFEKFNSLKLDAYEASAFCETVTNITNALGPEILPMAPLIINKALDITEAHLLNIKTHHQEKLSTDVVEACIDLISYVLDEANNESYNLIEAQSAPGVTKTPGSRLKEIIQICVCDPDFANYASLQQCIFALIGDIAPSMYQQILVPLLPSILPSITAKLIHNHWPVSSNASWCIGQIVEQAPNGDQTLIHFVPMIVDNLIQIIASDNPNLALKQNASITLVSTTYSLVPFQGRLSAVYSQQVAVKLDAVLMKWCNIMCQYKGFTEKIKAFKGIMRACMFVPDVARAHVDALQDCVADFYAPGFSHGDPELEQFLADMNQCKHHNQQQLL